MHIFTATCPNCRNKFHADQSILAVAEVRLRCPKCFQYFAHGLSDEQPGQTGQAHRVTYYEASSD